MSALGTAGRLPAVELVEPQRAMDEAIVREPRQTKESEDTSPIRRLVGIPGVLCTACSARAAAEPEIRIDELVPRLGLALFGDVLGVGGKQPDRGANTLR